MKTPTLETLTDDYGYPCREIRKLPRSGEGNILCSRRGYEREMMFRRDRIAKGEYYSLPAWKDLEIVDAI